MEYNARNRHTVFVSGLLYFLIGLNTQGCVFGAERTWSDINPVGFEQKEDGILHYQEISFDIYAGNHDACSAPVAFTGILVPIIPVPCFTKGRASEFWIAIKILPESAEFFLDLRQLNINVRGVKHSPSKFKIIGTPSPQTTSYKAGKVSPHCQPKEVIRQHNISAYDTLFSEYIPIPDGICIILTFPTLPPEPQEVFFITVNGLLKKDKIFLVPSIHVETKSEWYFDVFRNN